MLKNIKTLVKIFEGLMWLYLPIVMIYWSLSLVNMEEIAPLKATVGVMVLPLVIILDKYFDFQFSFKGEEVDYTPVILAAVVSSCAFIAMFTTKFLDFIEEKLDLARIENIRKKEKMTKEEQKELLIQELNRNKILYVMLRLIKIQKHDSYLINEGADDFTVGLIDSYENTIKNIASNFNGKLLKDYESEPDVINYLFTDTDQFLLYLHYLTEKIKEINKGTEIDLNTIFSYSIACNCSYDTATAETDLKHTNKILNLVGKEEIYITSVLKQKLENLDTEVKMKFVSKGLYILDEKDFDVYKLILK